MVRATYPNGPVILELVAAEAQPSSVPLHHFFLRFGFVPFTLIDAHHFAALHRDATARKEIRRVGKYHVELKVEVGHEFEAIAYALWRWTTADLGVVGTPSVTTKHRSCILVEIIPQPIVP